MVGGELGGDHVRVAKLVALALADVVEADAERRQLFLSRVGQQRDDQARVQAAGQQHSDRDVGHHPALDRGPGRLEDRLVPVLLGVTGVSLLAAEVRLPVAPLVALAVLGDEQRRRRGELADALQDRVRRRHDGMPAEVVVQRDRVELGVDAATGQQRRQRRGEPQRPVDVGQIQRFDPEPVTGEQQPPLTRARRSRTRTSP